MLPCTFFRLLFLAFLLLGLASLALPQTAEITGLVNDSSGAVIPGAKVAVMHEQTRLTRETVTNAEGYFTVLFLPPGSYEIRVSAEGFKPVVRSQVILNVGQVARLDFTLEVGPLSEQVTVSSEAPLLNTETPSVAQVVDNKLVETLPLNGRNYTQLVALTTGAVPNPISRAADAVQLNGHRVSQTTYFIDGVDNNNYIISADTGTTQTIRPSVDAIQEFRVESSNFNARYGRSAGGVVNVSIKSGTNDLHGTVFEFLRNDLFDATDFFTNRTGGKKNPYRFNQFGATLGGPFIKNRWFWFGSYQGTVIRTARTSVTTVPTPAMKQGVFPLPIHDPLTVNLGTLGRQPFPANTIPRDRWDGVAAKLVQLYRDPNLAGLANNYAGPITTETNHHQVDVRTDYLASAKDTLFFRLSRQDSKSTQGSLFGPPGYGGNFFLDQPVIRPMPAWSVVGGHNRIFSPAWANEFRLGYTHNFSDHQTPSQASLFADYGIRGVPRSEEIKGLPTFYPYGFSVLGDRLFQPNKRTAAVTHAADNVTWLRGRHTVQFGGEFRWIRQYYSAAAPGAQASRGIFVFVGLYTSPSVGALGLSLADFLLGQTTRLTISRDTDADLASYYSAFYVSDTWKLTTRLTLDVGLRYELLSPIWEAQNRMANFDLNPSSRTYGTLVRAKPGSIRDRSFVYLDKNNFGPRLGLAYRLTENTVVRAAGGIFYGGREYIELPPGNLPFSVAVSTRINPIISALPLQNGLPPGILDPENAIDPGASFLFERRPILETYQWNLSVQRGLPASLALTVSYVGSGTCHIAASAVTSASRPLVRPSAAFPSSHPSLRRVRTPMLLIIPSKQKSSDASCPAFPCSRPICGVMPSTAFPAART